MSFTENNEEENIIGQNDILQNEEHHADDQNTNRQTVAEQKNDKQRRLIFRIVDSPMGIGKSFSLMRHICFNPAYKEDEYVDGLKRTGLFNDLEHERYIIS